MAELSTPRWSFRITTWFPSELYGRGDLCCCPFLQSQKRGCCFNFDQDGLITTVEIYVNYQTLNQPYSPPSTVQPFWRLASRAQDILADLADLLTKAGIETTVTSDEEAAADMDAEMADDAMDAMADAEEDAEEAEEEAEVEMAESADSRMEALVAEITEKVMTRLNK